MSGSGPLASRPTRLSSAFQTAAGALLALSFLSGLILWRGHYLQMQQDEPPQWLHAWRVLHGSLNPVLCCVFGFLWQSHVRVGWRMKANRLSGASMVTVLGGLILSGAGLYYFSFGNVMFWAHITLGILLPLGLGAHLAAAQVWARARAKSG